MPLKEEVLDQFLGDEAFPVEWSSDTEKQLFWVYDDLHCPHPLSPMYEDIGGWWLSPDCLPRTAIGSWRSRRGLSLGSRATAGQFTSVAAAQA